MSTQLQAIQARLKVIKSNSYRTQLRVVRRELDRMDNLSLETDIDEPYAELERIEKRIIKNWRTFRGKNGMSNEAVPIR